MRGVLTLILGLTTETDPGTANWWDIGWNMSMWSFLRLLEVESALSTIYDSIVEEAHILLGRTAVSPADLLPHLPRIERRLHLKKRGVYMALGWHETHGWAFYIGATGDLYGWTIPQHRNGISHAIPDAELSDSEANEAQLVDVTEGQPAVDNVLEDQPSIYNVLEDGPSVDNITEDQSSIDNPAKPSKPKSERFHRFLAGEGWEVHSLLHTLATGKQCQRRRSGHHRGMGWLMCPCKFFNSSLEGGEAAQFDGMLHVREEEWKVKSDPRNDADCASML